MANRFSNEKSLLPGFFQKISQPKIGYLFFALIILVFLLSLSSIRSSTIQKQQESLNAAIMRDITHCYAVEGYYPPSLTYLEEHYGLTYNKDLFFVDYKPIGSNIRPDVTIILKEDPS